MNVAKNNSTKNDIPLTDLSAEQSAIAKVSSLETNDLSLDSFRRYMHDYIELDKVAKLIEAKQKAIKKVVFNGLEALKMDSIKNEYGKFTVVSESTYKDFDAKAFKEDAPKIYEQYLVDKTKRAYLKVTPAREKNTEVIS